MTSSDTDYRSPLAQYVKDWDPQPMTVTDPLDPVQAIKLADALDIAERFSVGDELPIPWHWAYFSDWQSTRDLGADGHPEFGQFLPPIPDRRRMFAGASITSHASVRLGLETERRTSVDTTALKRGRTGDMLFVKVRSEYRQLGRLAVTEEQNLVYRSAATTESRFAAAKSGLGEPAGRYHLEPRPNPIHLFRYSCLTSNAHRIHYDRHYATEVEGYPDLVVHGPLLAHYMADLARSHHTGIRLSAFEFRLKHPVFLCDDFRVEVDPDQGSTAAVTRVVTAGGVTNAIGKVTYR